MNRADELHWIGALQEIAKNTKDIRLVLAKLADPAKNFTQIIDGLGEVIKTLPEESENQHPELLLHGAIPVVFDVTEPGLEGGAAILQHEDGQIEISIRLSKRDSQRFSEDFGRGYRFDTFVLSDVMLEPEPEPE